MSEPRATPHESNENCPFCGEKMVEGPIRHITSACKRKTEMSNGGSGQGLHESRDVATAKGTPSSRAEIEAANATTASPSIPSETRGMCPENMQPCDMGCTGGWCVTLHGSPEIAAAHAEKITTTDGPCTPEKVASVASATRENEAGEGGKCPVCDQPALRLVFDSKTLMWDCKACGTISGNDVTTTINALLARAASPVAGTDPWMPCEPWSLIDVVRKLADAADHLLTDHGCDTHGHEAIATARDAARRWLAAAPEVPRPSGKNRHWCEGCTPENCPGCFLPEAPTTNAAPQAGEFTQAGPAATSTRKDGSAGAASVPNAVERMHGLVEQLAARFKGYLPWPEEKRDAVVRGHEAFIEDTIRKADALACTAPPTAATRPLPLCRTCRERRNTNCGDTMCPYTAPTTRVTK